MENSVLAHELREHLAFRRMTLGQSTIERNAPELRAARAGDPGVTDLFYILSGWVPYSPAASEFARGLATAFGACPWPDLSLKDWAKVVAGKAWLAFYDRLDGDVDAAQRWLADNEPRLGSCVELSAAMSLVCALSYKRRAEYPLAAESVKRAMRLYREAGFPLMVAVAQVSEGWLQMQAGDLDAANETWNVSWDALKDTDDWTTQASIWFSRARCLGRGCAYKEGHNAFWHTISLYKKRTPNDRNLRRTLIELANLLHRMSGGSPPAEAGRLRQEGAAAIREATELLEGDPADTRNAIRLCFAQMHQALAAVHPRYFEALQPVRRAHDLAQAKQDGLMLARALLEWAEIEARFASNMEEPLRARIRACHRGMEACELAATISDNRLKARIHTFLGNLFSGETAGEKLLLDLERAQEHLEAARKCMSNRQDRDYVSVNIEKLATKIQRMSSGGAK